VSRVAVLYTECTDFDLFWEKKNIVREMKGALKARHDLKDVFFPF
jgi:hypothetical protein